MKTLLIYLAGITLGTVINFTIFMVAYKKLVFPLLHEDQRMDIAPYLFSHVLTVYLLASFLLVVILQFLIKFRD